MRLIKLIIGLMGVFLPFLSVAQGTKFESGLNWKQIQAKAKAENKYIFVDCYATWCGPCKWMSTNIFPEKETGDFMNSHFINVAVQMDRTVKDDKAIRDWYLDAAKLQQEYKVDAYPTYLFFSPEGQPLHRFTGSRGTVKDFISEVNIVFHPEKRYYSTTRQWESHKSDTGFLWTAYLNARKQRDVALADSIGTSYLSLQPDLLTKKNIIVIVACKLIQSSKDKWFQLFLNNSVTINDAMDSEGDKATFVPAQLASTIYKEEVLPYYFDGKPIQWQLIQAVLKEKYPSLFNNLVKDIRDDIRAHIEKEIDAIIGKDKSKEVDWAGTQEKLKQRYPDFDFGLQLLQMQTNYYAVKKEWTKCADGAYQLMIKYQDQIDDWDMNNIIWEYVFTHSNSTKVLTAAQMVMRDIVKKPSTKCIYLDTYANLLYKTGKKNEAFDSEYKAIERCLKQKGQYADLEAFVTNLKKMQYGQATWEN